MSEWNIAKRLGAALHIEFTNFKGKLTSDKFEELQMKAWVRVANGIKETERREILPFQDLYTEPVASLMGEKVEIFSTYVLKPETLFYVMKRNIKGDE